MTNKAYIVSVIYRMLAVLPSLYAVNKCDVQTTAHQTIHFLTLHRSYFKGISAKIGLQVYIVTSCLPYSECNPSITL
jgi:hypothetical protein